MPASIAHVQRVRGRCFSPLILVGPHSSPSLCRVEEEMSARARSEKENSLLQGQLQELQDDLDSEKDSRARVEKARKTLNDELEHLRDSLEQSESFTAAQQEIRTQREQELLQLKKTLDEEIAAHQASVASMKTKHSMLVKELDQQLESLKKVCLLLKLVMVIFTWLLCM